MIGKGGSNTRAHLYDCAKLIKHILENDMLNGEVIRLDGAIRLAPK